MDSALAIATLIAGLAGVFTIIKIVMDPRCEQERFKKYINERMTRQRTYINKSMNTVFKDTRIQKTFIEMTMKHIQDLVYVLKSELTKRENIGKYKKLTKEIEKRIEKLTDLRNEIQQMKSQHEEISEDDWEKIKDRIYEQTRDF